MGLRFELGLKSGLNLGLGYLGRAASDPLEGPPAKLSVVASLKFSEHMLVKEKDEEG